MTLTSIFKMQVGLMILFLLASSNTTYSSEDGEYLFRHTKWGMSQEEVKKAENGEPNPGFSNKTIVYKSELMGENVLIVYTFAFNKLIRAKYMLLKYFDLNQQKRFNSSDLPKKPFIGECLADFDRFEKALIEKYGKPKTQRAGFSKETDLDNKERSDAEDLEVMENAIRDKKGYWSSAWETKDTDILLFLHGEAGKLIFEISYSSIKLRDLEKDSPL